MIAISISITESQEQVVAGIPKTIELAANIPSSIFYTLDGTTPTTSSNIYIDPIFLPANKLSVTLKVFASTGTDTSSIVTQIYLTNIIGDTRLAHSATDVSPEDNIPSLYPFGSPQIQPMGQYLNPAEAGTTVNNPALTQIPSAFDGLGNLAAPTNKPFDLENYAIVYSTTDAQGQTGPGVGTLPATVKIKLEEAPPETTNQFSNFFDPRAFVIFQDASKENPNDPPNINRQFFSMENPEKTRDGNSFFTTGLDSPPLSGSFIRSHYNPRDNTITYYYMDSWTNKWIISKTPYQPNGGTWDGNMSGMVLSKQQGAGFVHEWRTFARRVLF